MNKFEKMRIFVQVVESNGFISAARKLSLSKASVSKQISHLEDQLKVALLRRTTRGTLQLTELGREYYLRCKKLISDFEDCEGFASSLNTEPQGNLRIVATRFFGESFIVPYLKEFMQLYPKIELNLELNERVPNLEKEEIDVLFALSLPGESNWIRKPISKTKYIFVASKEYLKKFGEPEQPEDLMRHVYIAHIMRKPHKIVDFGGGKTIGVQPQLILNDTRTMLKCALDGIGICRLHEYMVRDAIKDGKLVELYKTYNQQEVFVYLYYLESEFLAPKIRIFNDFFTAKISL
jgi:DNA-binding transcriptional LysR family regulator